MDDAAVLRVRSVLDQLCFLYGPENVKEAIAQKFPPTEGRPGNHDDDVALFFIQLLIELGKCKRGAAITRVTQVEQKADRREYHRLNQLSRRREAEFKRHVDTLLVEGKVPQPLWPLHANPVTRPRLAKILHIAKFDGTRLVSSN